jgi:hypothetical protein
MVEHKIEHNKYFITDLGKDFYSFGLDERFRKMNVLAE